MVSPQEARFSRLVCAENVLTKQQLEACSSVRAKKEDQGSKTKLWDCAVRMGMLEGTVAEKLADKAGDLPMDRLGDYAIQHKLGEGGMGSVYLGISPDGQKVALKVLSPLLARQGSLLNRFMREAESCCRLRHKNLVCGIGVGEDEGHYYFAMEYVDGPDVDHVLKTDGPLPVDVATDYIGQVAEGLAYAHGLGIVHRDIKPGNIMVTSDGVAKLSDLGLARCLDEGDSALTRTGTAMGTPFYMAPEQATDAKRADARSDIYALGGAWYHMIAGRPPFDGTTPVGLLLMHLKEPLKPLRTVVPGVPEAVSSTIERMMAKEPEDRIQTAAELVRIIRAECLGPARKAARRSAGKGKAAELPSDLAATRIEPRRPSAASHAMDTLCDVQKPAAEARAGTGRVWPVVVGVVILLAIGALVWHFLL